MPLDLTAYSQADASTPTDLPQVGHGTDRLRPNPSNGTGGGTASAAPNDSLNTLSGQLGGVVLPPTPRLLRPETLAFRRLEARDGVVLDVNLEEGVFRARLVDPRAVEPDQEVVLDVQQVSPTDLALLEPGALFFWAIGYVTRRTGRRNLVLAIDFRRLPRPRRDVEARALVEGERYAEGMNWS